jgi:hypothetical protein
MQKYRLQVATIAVRREAARRVAITIPSGTVLKALDAPSDADGFVEVELGGDRIKIFAVDLRDRGEILRTV